MSDLYSTFLLRFNEIVDESAVFLFITRDAELQKQACDKLDDLLRQAAAEKESAVADGNEDYANALLGCECIASAFISEIRMWLLLKEGQPEKAWDMLINAEDGLSGAVRAHDGFAHIIHHVRRLDVIERLVFPPQVFMSSGMIVKNQICSICNQEYDDCCHVKGRPYAGKFCTVTLVAPQVDHVAFVDNPANKRCRAVKFSAGEGYRNKMTWRIEPKDIENDEGPENLSVQGIVATSSTFGE